MTQKIIATVLDPVLALVYPPKCTVCRTFGAAVMCERCLRSIVPVAEPSCGRCGQTLGEAGACGHCTKRAPAFDKARALGAHDSVLKHAIHLLKYRDRPRLAEPLGIALAAFARDHSADLGNLKIDMVVPVPMHPARRRTRGYNQAERLAAVVARELLLSMSADALVRRVNTKAQVGLTQEARQQNLTGAFGAGSLTVTGMSILVIDDVSTTGSSLHECALALKSAGANKVYALTLAAG